MDLKKRGMHQRSKLLTEEGKLFLDEEKFRSIDFWEGYKLYCFAYYSQCRSSSGQFLACKMGRVVNMIQKQRHVLWGFLLDEQVRQVWAMMEEYGDIYHGEDWRNLRALMEEFDDVKELSASENGCLLLQLVEDDEDGTETLHRQSQPLKVQSTNIFDELHVRLKRVGSNLDTLKESLEGTSRSGVKKRRSAAPQHVGCATM